MLDVVPPVVRDGGRGCLYTAEPTDGCPRDSEAVHQCLRSQRPSVWVPVRLSVLLMFYL